MNRTAALVLILAALGGVFLYLTRSERPSAAASVAGNLDAIHRKVMDDAIAQYDITKRNGSAMDRCGQAGFVKAAALQAQDEATFARWKAVETADCAAADVAQP